MNDNPQKFEDVPQKYPLKRAEPKIKDEVPWEDDALGRVDVAKKLTNLVRDQKTSLVISLDGSWGTGKTFLLKRWEKQLNNENFKAIYFNAWEDDFCNDPLVAIIGQLSSVFSESSLKKIVDKIKKSAKSLLIHGGMLKIATVLGITSPNYFFKKLSDSVPNEYLSSKESKDRLKEHLLEMAEKVMKKTEQPLVFIVDELDRCRPTFSIELLETVKHIFDIPGIVFVFGINQKELCNSIESVYGEIESVIYLRRFFDISLSLPDANTEDFCRYLIDRYQLNKLFDELSEVAQNPVHKKEFGAFSERFILFYNYFGLSLRDLDFCIRSMLFVAKNIPMRHPIYPFLTGTLIVLRLQEPLLYRKFCKGECHGSDVMNYIDDKIPNVKPDSDINQILLGIELNLYATYDREEMAFKLDITLDQLRLLSEGKSLTHPEYLSKKTQQDKERASALLYYYQRGPYPEKINISYIQHLIELTKVQ